MIESWRFGLFVFVLAVAVPSRWVAAGSCPYKDSGMTDTQCARVAAVTASWKSAPLAAIPVTLGHADPASGAADAATHNDAIGPCRYAEAEGRVEIMAQAFKLSDEAFGSCVAAAFAQARYDAVEAKWLESMGEREAWVVRGGVLTKVSVGEKKMEPPAARQLWASLATSELQGAGTNGESSRAIASSAKDPGGAEASVRELLGLQ